MDNVKEYLAKIGKRGGKARLIKMTAEQRKNAASKAAQARWAKLRETVDDITQRSKALEKRATRKVKNKK